MRRARAPSTSMPAQSRPAVAGSGTAGIWPRISPAGKLVVWMLMYERPDSTSVSRVGVRLNVALNVPDVAPVTKGGMNGRTTPALTPGGAQQWMWALLVGDVRS